MRRYIRLSKKVPKIFTWWWNYGLIETSKVMMNKIHRTKYDGEQDWTSVFEVKPGETVIDVGADIGSFSSEALNKVGSSGKVIAIEPNPRSIQTLQNKFEDAENFFLYPLAVSDYNGESTLYINEEHEGSSSLFKETATEFYNQVTKNTTTTVDVKVNVKTLDYIYDDLEENIINFVKIDIESGEISSLHGAKNLLDNTQKIMVEAAHPVPGTVTSDNPTGTPTATKVEGILNDAGFNTCISYNMNVWGWRDEVDVNRLFVFAQSAEYIQSRL